MIKVAQPIIGAREQRAVRRVLRSGSLAQGPEVLAFENEFSHFLGQGISTVAVNSGTSALHLGLLAAGVGRGHEVIVPSFSFAATANSVALTGAQPVFCDIEPETYCLNPEMVKTLITSRTRGIMPVHMFGHPADMRKLSEISVSTGIPLFEDAAQAHGAEVSGRKVGTIGQFGAFSLYPTKNITSGEGGVLSSLDDQLLRMVRLLRNQGMERRYDHEIVGFNNRMTDIHAAIGRVQLTRIGRFTEKRRANAEFLSGLLQNIVTPIERPGCVHVYHQFTIRIPEDRDGFAQALSKEHGVASGIYYPTACHHQKSLARFAAGSDFEQTNRATREVLSLPIHPGLRRRNLRKIAKSVATVMAAGG